MRSFMCVYLVLLCLSVFSSPCIAADGARFKCQVQPRQAETGPVRTNWNGVIRQKLSIEGRGNWQDIPFVVAPDGFRPFEFVRPSRGYTLEVVIRILGGWPAWRLYEDSELHFICLLYTSPSPRDGLLSRMPSSA